MKKALGCLLALVVSVGAMAQTQHRAPLKIYFIDVEGGQSTLFVTPEHESLLIDTGWPDNNGRDAKRILKAARQAGIKKIDYLLLTHFHTDHVGGVPQLAKLIPIGTFIDHGPNREKTDKATEQGYEAYQALLATGKYHHIVAHPGELLPIPGMHVEVISADGNLIDQPLAGGGQPNPYCKVSQPRSADKTENARSLGVLITYGQFRVLDLGDLTWDKEMQLMCPANPIGTVNLLVVSHHGWYQSSSPALVDAVHPEVAIMDNGEHKGGSKPTLKTIDAAPGLDALYQLHYSDEGTTDNTASPRIANLQGTDPGYGIDVAANANGSFSVTNLRTGQKVDYPGPGKEISAR
jgi:competence protein ComEC